MAEHAREPGDRDLAVDEMQVGPAHAARPNAEQHLTGPRLGHREVERLERAADPAFLEEMTDAVLTHELDPATAVDRLLARLPEEDLEPDG